MLNVFAFKRLWSNMECFLFVKVARAGHPECAFHTLIPTFALSDPSPHGVVCLLALIVCIKGCNLNSYLSGDFEY